MRKLVCLLLLSIVCLAQSTLHSVTLTWTWTQGTGVAANGFNVYRATIANGTFILVGSTPANVFTYTDSTVASLPGSSFYYYVAAFNTPNNLFGPSAVVGVTPAATISAPSGVAAAIK